MTDPSDPASFSSLPVEMKANIFAFIRAKATKVAVCLVNHEWRDIMAPMAFENLTIVETHITPEMLNTILEPGNGLIPHVKSLYLGYDSTDEMPDDQCDCSIEIIAQLIISEIPKGALRVLAGDVNLPTGMLFQVLQHQTKLKRLDVAFGSWPNSENISYAHGAHASWIARRLADIESLTVMRHGAGDVECKAVGLLVRSASRLKALKIVGRGHHPSLLEYRQRHETTANYNVFGGPFESGRAPPRLCLSRLSLEHVNVGPSMFLIRRNVDLSTLKCLQLINFEGIDWFLELFAPVCNLTELKITMAPDSAPQGFTRRAVEALLNSFRGLKVLWLDLADGRMVNVSCIARHTTLCQLGIDGQITLRKPVLSPENFATLLQSLPNLEGLAVHLCFVLYDQALESEREAELAPDRCRDEMLLGQRIYFDHVAAHPHLKHLRILGEPVWIDIPDEMSRCIAPGRGDVTAAMQLYATRVMSYLNDSGSQVRVLGIARSENYFPEDRVLEDYNGHVWPEYYYRMGRVVDSEENLEGEETSGEETVVAVPMRRRPGMLVNTVFNQMFTVNRGLGGA